FVCDAMMTDLVQAQRSEIVDLRSRPDREQQLMDIDGNQYEETVFWWFFQPLQQSIRSFWVECVGGIDDEYFAASLQRLKLERREQLPDLRDLDLRCVFRNGNSHHVRVRT